MDATSNSNLEDTAKKTLRKKINKLNVFITKKRDREICYPFLEIK